MPSSGIRQPIIGVIGGLQFDVIAARMSSEYGIPCTVDRMPHVAVRWPIVPPGLTLALPTLGVVQATDRLGRPVLVFEADWLLPYTFEKNPNIEFRNSM
jgi:peptide chain release factor 3